MACVKVDDVAENAISFTGIRKVFGRVVAVDGLDLKIEHGERVAILGPNGAGKSTLLNMVLGLLDPNAGGLEVLGGAPRAALADGRMGAMLQESGLIDEVTAGELISAMRALYPRPRTIDEVFASAGVTDLRNRRLGRLSGGQKQRVRFALALLGDPELLILDEPTAGLDVESRRGLWEEVTPISATGRTVVFATHYLAEAEAHADRIVLLSGGRVVADGTVDAIKSSVPFRIVECTLPDPELAILRQLPGAASVEFRGRRVMLHSTDSDATLRAMLEKYPRARGFDVRGVDLEVAFVALTRGGVECSVTSG